MSALSESFSFTIIHDVFSLLILTFLLFSQVGKPVLDTLMASGIYLPPLLTPLLLFVSLLQMRALHYLAGDRVTEGFWTVASACALHQPTIVGASISRIVVHKFGT